MKLKGKKVLITGGSLGIGKETAKQLTDLGAEVVFTSRSQKRIQEAERYSGATGIVFDISELNNITHKAKECVKLLGGNVDILINNAGIGSFNPIEEISSTSFETIFNTNVFGLALLSKEIIPLMKNQNSGTIINIGSSASLKGFKNGSIYAASKFAVRALTQCWQTELRTHNIRVCQINPSEVTTAFYNDDRNERGDQSNKLSSKEITHSIISILNMEEKGFITELNVWATNPF